MRSLKIICLVLGAGFFLTACNSSGAKTDNTAEQFFTENKVTGCFALYDNSQDIIHVYNLPCFRDSNFTPASTFKIVNSLIGLETGRISDTNMIIKWDGVKRFREEWNQDLTMGQAFRFSSVPYYQEVARRIGRDTMQRFIDSLGYGNKNISGPIDSFWLNNQLKITPNEELGLMKRIYFSQLKFFSERSMRLVRGVMLRENNANYQLSYKTGWGFTENKHAIGWVTGWIEENKHPYFFVLLIKSPDENFDIAPARTKMLKDILTAKGFFLGKK
jgi:beta-lactamase class D